MPATFVVVPQWQGAVSARAMSHADGAFAIQGDLPASSTIAVEVPVEAGETLDTGVRRYSTLLRMRERVEVALGGVAGSAIVVGGDCGVALPAVAHAMSTGSDERADAAADVAVLWLDAHPDLNTPESSPSGAFNGMVLRAIMGEGADGLALDERTRIAPERVVLGGIRSVDDAEQEFIDACGIRSIEVDDFADAQAVVEAVAATGATRVFVHIDLDVLDPSAIVGISYPVPFGLDPATLIAAVKAVVARFPLAGASIAGFAPSSPEAADDDLPTILRVIGALASAPSRAASDASRRAAAAVDGDASTGPGAASAP